ncbi:uncharacterized protein M6B38_113885 [Iris pallida]|uniref:Uncharacterized protein n=1 Tax=Iris pallida TaxID=29817 RepID=A0AAX6I140_IRIPA|nr:uncharacterized protein M6B38_235840 [Iris pallida]KAJ6847040.1 uncharacterized protein M6B38_284535 [Iris pallida]KAJ6853866.1 uncharacterized protein M6B38_113885 [Iris pallida]
MLHPLLLSSFLLLLLLPTPTTSSSSSSNSTIYDLLPKYGLPPGLLPDNVQSFSLSQNGRFSVQLQSRCQIEFDYLVSYDADISGTLKYGSIRDLKGVHARKFLIWFDVDAIKVDLPPSDYVYFEVGWITKKLDAEQFRTVHSCEKNELIREPTEEISMLITE